jgi:hypothetical protein
MGSFAFVRVRYAYASRVRRTCRVMVPCRRVMARIASRRYPTATLVLSHWRRRLAVARRTRSLVRMTVHHVQAEEETIEIEP